MIALLGLLAGVAYCEPRHLPNDALVQGDEVRMRAQPSTKGRYVDVLYNNQLVRVLERSATTEMIGSEALPWYLVRRESSTGWVFGGFLTFNVPVPLPNTYAASPDISWFLAKYGTSTGSYEGQLDVSSFSTAEYRSLAQAAISSTPSPEREAARSALCVTVYPHLQRAPSDPQYAYLKELLCSDAYLRAWFKVHEYGPSLVRVLPSASLTRPRILEWIRMSHEPYWADDLFTYLPRPLKDDRRIAEALLDRAAWLFRSFPEGLRSDPDLAMKAVKLDAYNYCRLPQVLQALRSYAIAATQKSAEVFQCLPEAFRREDAFIERSIKSAAYNYHYLPDDLQRTRRWALLAARSPNGYYESTDEEFNAWKEVLSNFPDDLEIALLLVRSDFTCYPLLSNALMHSREVALAALSGRQGAKLFASLPSQFQDDKSFVLWVMSMKWGGEQLQYVSDRLQDDEEVVTAAFNNLRCSLKWASPRLQAKISAAEHFDIAGCK